MMLDEVNRQAPDLIGQYRAALESLSQNFPRDPNLDSALGRLNRNGQETEEDRLSRADKDPNTQTRDIVYFNSVAQAWIRSDFKRARVLTAKISDDDLRAKVLTMIGFGEVKASLKNKGYALSDAFAAANTIPSPAMRALLFLDIGQLAVKRGESDVAVNSLNNALSSATLVKDERRPFLILKTASELMQSDPIAARTTYLEGLKALNELESVPHEERLWVELVEFGPLKFPFPLKIDDLDMSFVSSFRVAVETDFQYAIDTTDTIRLPTYKTDALVGVAEAAISKAIARNEKSEQTNKNTSVKSPL
jgi:hypothetical protein